MCNINLGRETLLLEFGLLEMVHVILLSKGELQMFWFWSLWKVEQLRNTRMLQHLIGMWVFYWSFSLIYTFLVACDYQFDFLVIIQSCIYDFFLYRVREPCLQQVLTKAKSEYGTDMVRDMEETLVLKIECINWPLESIVPEMRLLVCSLDYFHNIPLLLMSCLSDWN